MPTNKQRRETAKRKLERQLERRAQQAKRRRILTIAGAGVAAVAVVAAVVVAVVVSKNDHKGKPSASTTPSSATSGSAATNLPPVDLAGAVPMPQFKAPANLGANCQYPATKDEKAAKEVKPPRTGKVPTEPAQVSVSMVTNQGNIGLMLTNNQSPCTVNSFISLATQGFFKDTKCHRLVASAGLSVLQCGDPTGTGTGGPGYDFANEFPTNQFPPNDPKLKQPVIYPRGTLAMAHSEKPNSNGSQFFMVYRDSALPPDYTVFGTIQADGLTTLDKIASAGVAGGGPEGAPATDVVITSVLPD
ncbi:peptidylprolyl isomerase [Mycobacterium vicinigordonae]|uniref:Peptidylprolyl isomerase n=1 Tax=Mycobacterium vicinigordonae TaxID=1719132 RepID=A0A7D6IBB4_9MYCO|nr:peptidylprolyl isomerase [Mycobacterium vicinigordonae]QLL09457.1 peptidylprolyl isomerase [Mycobacterium vicinigordonae]